MILGNPQLQQAFQLNEPSGTIPPSDITNYPVILAIDLDLLPGNELLNNELSM